MHGNTFHNNRTFIGIKQLSTESGIIYKMMRKGGEERDKKKQHHAVGCPFGRVGFC